jgi:hypothetical protein
MECNYCEYLKPSLAESQANVAAAEKHLVIASLRGDDSFAQRLREYQELKQYQRNVLQHLADHKEYFHN